MSVDATGAGQVSSPVLAKRLCGHVEDWQLHSTPPLRQISPRGVSFMAQKSCVGIGAGLAGLAAAYELTLKDWKVTVLEASNRLGGRVLSHTFDQAPHLICELGGEWIGNDHKEMLHLCHQLGLETIPHQYCNSFMERGKPRRIYGPIQLCMSPEARKAFRRFTAYFRGLTTAGRKLVDKRDWWTQLELFKYPTDDLLRRDLMDSTDFGESIRHTSAYVGATEYISPRGSRTRSADEMDKKIVSGNSKLVKALACRIGAKNIKTRHVVEQIRRSRRGVEIRAKGKGRIRADYCICSIPTHALRKIRGYPEPKKHLEAARELQYARITKTAVLVRDKFWPQPKAGGYAVFTDLVSDYCFESAYLQDGPMGILCSYAIGEKADDVDAADVTELGEWIAGDVATAVTGRRHDVMPVAVKRQSWRQDPYTGGAYAFCRPGQWFNLRPALARRFGRVLFAGEHLSKKWQGFMEGAVETGKAAATAVA